MLESGQDIDLSNLSAESYLLLSSLRAINDDIIHDHSISWLRVTFILRLAFPTWEGAMLALSEGEVHISPFLLPPETQELLFPSDDICSEEPGMCN